jgi:hypothetical protein
MNTLITVSLTDRQFRLIQSCINEAGGGSAAAFAAICNQPGSSIDRVRDTTSLLPAEGPFALVEADWHVVFDAVHAAMYALGPFEVPVVLGSSLVELADVNLRICIDVWGAYGGLTWAERS